MSIKQRLIKLEAQQGDENIALINKETSQWARLYLDDLIQRINDGTYISKPWVISKWNKITLSNDGYGEIV